MRGGYGHLRGGAPAFDSAISGKSPRSTSIRGHCRGYRSICNPATRLTAIFGTSFISLLSNGHRGQPHDLQAERRDDRDVQYNAADEITNTGFTYDANGNLTAKPGQTYAYNSLNQTTSITTAGTPIAMAYADVGQGERTTAGSTAFLTGLLGMTRQTGGSTLAFTRTPGGSLVSMRSGTSHFYYIFDALGSVIALTDGSGAIAASYTYDSYGTPLTTSGAQATVNPFRFASGYFDSATGLLKFGARYYDPSLGRWTQRDPIAGSIADPGAMDRYVYASDNPTNLTDASGALDTGALLGYAAAGCLTGIRNDLFAAAAIGIGTGQVELSLLSLGFGCLAGAGMEVSSQLGNPYLIAAFGVAESVNIVFSFLGAL